MIRDSHPNSSVDLKRPGKHIGYWKEDSEPEGYIDTDWGAQERDLVIRFLESGKVLHRWRGSSRCRICGERNGSECLTDGAWVWPQGLAHYLREHGVRPPQAFVEYVIKKMVPNPLEMMTEEKVRAMIEAIGGDPDAEVLAIAKMKEMRVVFERVRVLAENRDILVAIHLQEIIQHGCDLIAYLGEEFDPLLLRGILNTAVGFATSGTPKWKHYTEVHAPVVNENIIRKNSPPESGCDA